MSQHFSWWPGRKADQIVWLNNCLVVLVTAGPALGFTPAQNLALTLLLTDFLAVLNGVDQCQFAMRAINEWKKETLYGAETNKPVPAPPTITSPEPPTAQGGFFLQLKRWRGLVLASPNYTNAIGEALGFVGQQKNSFNPELATPNFKVTTSSDYWVNFSGSLQGFDAVNVDYLRKGGASWTNIGFLTKTPGGLQITPAAEGTAEMGMVRCVFIRKNQIVGNYSPNYPVTIS